jgi:hypothetical protein
MMFLEEKERN